MATLKKTCHMCNQTTGAEGEDVLFFGEWMTRNKVTVHYYCLLLSTNLVQVGKDNAGILGFLLRDIRKEAVLAKSRNCKYCDKPSATIMCHICKEYFHLTCGFTATALSQFQDQFISYCHKCIPLDDTIRKLQKDPPPPGQAHCIICLKSMGYCEPTRWIYGKCCGNGYAHSKCMQEYALKAGYYLKCPWCQSKRFRDDVKNLGIFVPDRDAIWEREPGAYKQLYRRHQRCDMEICNCVKGRDYTTAHKWPIILCIFCGSFGAHNPLCIPGMEHEKERIKVFKCETCAATERTCSPTAPKEAESDDDLAEINTTLYMHKELKPFKPSPQRDSPEFSDDGTLSAVTVIEAKLKCNTSEINKSFDKMQPPAVQNTSLAAKGTALQQTPTATHIPSLTQCDESFEKSASSIRTSAQLNIQTESTKKNKTYKTVPRPSSPSIPSCKSLDIEMESSTVENGTNETTDPRVVKLLVQRMLDLFE